MSQVAATEITAPTIVRDAAAGDRAAFAQLIARHHARMMRVAHVITGDCENAADAVQSAWEIAWRRLGSLRDPDQVGSWLVAIAANEARQTRRRQHRHTVVDISNLLDLPGAPDPGEAVSLVDLKRAMAELNADDRMLLALRFVGDLDSETIALHLGISASGARSRLMRLLDKLRVQLDPPSEARS
jgi:RNA polymerase sigma-70 factor (ECF subfamily)